MLGTLLKDYGEKGTESGIGRVQDINQIPIPTLHPFLFLIFCLSDFLLLGLRSSLPNTPYRPYASSVGEGRRPKKEEKIGKTDRLFFLFLWCSLRSWTP